MRGMNKLSRTARAQILGLMVEGMSLRAISRTTGASKNTIVKLLEDAGASALTRIDPLLLMETDPAGAHEFVVRWPDRPVAGVVGGKFSLA